MVRGVQYPVRIVDLDKKTAPQTSDLIPIYSNNDGDTMSISIQSLIAMVVAAVGVADTKQTQYTNLSASPVQVVTPTAPNTSVWLLMTPSGTVAAATLTLPPVTSANDRMEVLISSTQTVTALTIQTGNAGTGVVGAPNTIAANSAIRMRYDAATNSWYRA